MGIFKIFKRERNKNNQIEEKDIKQESENQEENNIIVKSDIDIETSEQNLSEVFKSEIIEDVVEIKLTKEEVDELIYNEILRIIELYDDFEKFTLASLEASRKIGIENINEIAKFLNGKIHRPTKYINKYSNDEEWTVVVENAILMIIYSYKGEAVKILKRVSQKNSKLNLKAINLLCKLANEKIQRKEIIDWITHNLIAFNDENKIKILGFMSQIKGESQVVGLIQYFYKCFVKEGEIEYAYKTLKHLITAADQFTDGHLKFLKAIAMGKSTLNLEEIMTLEEGFPKSIELPKISDELSIEATITYYTLDNKDDDINSRLYYLSEYSLDGELREGLKKLLSQ
ncbi:MAG: hypothetical protein IJO26_01940 [Clostridium sp.]|nr:hypothetical protein [Clostridium sp.]